MTSLGGQQGSSQAASKAAFVTARLTCQDLHARDPQGYTLLMRACMQKNEREACWLVELGADVNARSLLTGYTALCYSAQECKSATVGILLSAGADPNVASYIGDTPLMAACRRGSMKLVTKLLQAGANPQATSTKGETAQLLVATSCAASSVKSLIVTQLGKFSHTLARPAGTFIPQNITANNPPHSMATAGLGPGKPSGAASGGINSQVSKANPASQAKVRYVPIHTASSSAASGKGKRRKTATKAANSSRNKSTGNAAAHAHQRSPGKQAASSGLSTTTLSSQAASSTSSSKSMLTAQAKQAKVDALPATPRANIQLATPADAAQNKLTAPSNCLLPAKADTQARSVPNGQLADPTQSATQALGSAHLQLSAGKANPSGDGSLVLLSSTSAEQKSTHDPKVQTGCPLPAPKHLKAAFTQRLTLEAHELALFQHPMMAERGLQLLKAAEGHCEVACELPSDSSRLDTVLVKGVKMQVLQGDLTQQDVDAIAGAEHPPQTGHSVSAVPRATTGTTHSLFQGLADLWSSLWFDVQTKPNTPPDKPKRHFIQAVGPPYTGGGSGNANDLEVAVLRALSQAGKLQAKSVALPLMGAGRARWPTDTAAKLQIAAALQYIHQGTATSLEEVRFVDTNPSAVAALKTHLGAQAATRFITIKGDEAQCQKAMQHIKAGIQACVTSAEIKLGSALGSPAEQALLSSDALASVSAHVTLNSTLLLKGCEQLVNRAEMHALRFLYEAMHSSSSGAPYPSSWQPQSSANTELFEVPVNSPEVQGLVWSVHCAGGTVVKVHRIQNKKLWRAFSHSQASMKERWAHEPGLPLLNGGLETLWHGTTHTEPRKIYATELGFTPNFASLRGAWGIGIYYSTKPALAMHFGHSPMHSDLALAGFGRSERQGLKQVLAVDVLTGKSKHLSQDTALRMPPKIEDTRLAERLGIPELRYDSVAGTYNSCQTPIYITYNSAHGYPKYLISYK